MIKPCRQCSDNPQAHRVSFAVRAAFGLSSGLVAVKRLSAQEFPSNSPSIELKSALVVPLRFVFVLAALFRILNLFELRLVVRTRVPFLQLAIAVLAGEIIMYAVVTG